MGFLDNLSNSINRGTASAERGMQKMQLNSQINDFAKRRARFCQQLGESLYAQIKDDPAMCEGRESILDGIAECDAQIAALNQQVATIDAASAAASASRGTQPCPECGTLLAPGQMFCSACGTKLPEVAPAGPSNIPQPRACASCGAVTGASDAFCMSCGTKLS